MFISGNRQVDDCWISVAFLYFLFFSPVVFLYITCINKGENEFKVIAKILQLLREQNLGDSLFWVT